MDILRRHLFIIICGVVSVAGVALIATGLKAMPTVEEAMEDSKRMYEELSTLQREPVNQRGVEAEMERIELTVEDRDKVAAEAASLYEGYEPLAPGVFPDGDDDARRAFRRAYEEAMRRLMEPLHWGQPAADSDIENMEDRIADEGYRAQERGMDPGAPQPERPDFGPPRTPAGVLTKSGARLDPKARAHMAAAQNIQCYAIPRRTDDPTQRDAGLDFDVDMLDMGEVDAPSPEAVWRAQIGYWIQRDVVRAIAALNDEATRAARERQEDPWVGIMPVKELISIRVSEDYVLPEGDVFASAPPGGYEEALPPGSSASVFTESGCSALHEVKQFSVKLIVDQRDIPRLVDRICHGRFHTLLRVAYEAVPPNRNMRDKIYGSEPVVNVVLDFETIMLGDVFRPLMPPVVCQALADEDYGIECPGPEEEEGEEEEG